MVSREGAFDVKRFVFLALVFASACSDNPGGGTADAGADLGADAGHSDATVDDSSVADLGLTDLGGADAAATDAEIDSAVGDDLGVGEDAGLTDAAIAEDAAPADDAGLCNYIDLTPFATDCSGTMTIGTSWVNVEGASDMCPTYYTINGGMGASELAAIAEGGCSSICVYHATTAVDLLFCGHRFGYEQWEEGRVEICPNMITVGGEFYPDFETYSASHPCP